MTESTKSTESGKAVQNDSIYHYNGSESEKKPVSTNKFSKKFEVSSITSDP